MPSSPTSFTVHGPFDIPYDSQRRGTSKHIGRNHALEFWAGPAVAAFRKGRGCYVFALASGPGFSPWYVGKTIKGFEAETFQDHKLAYYNEVVYKGRKGKPVLFLLTVDEVGRSTPKAAINRLETFLIESAAFKNPDLVNKAGVLPWGIKGVLRGGRGHTLESRRFKAMMGL